MGGAGRGAGVPRRDRGAADLGPEAPDALLPDLHPAALAQLAGAGRRSSSAVTARSLAGVPGRGRWPGRSWRRQVAAPALADAARRWGRRSIRPSCSRRPRRGTCGRARCSPRTWPCRRCWPARPAMLAVAGLASARRRGRRRARRCWPSAAGAHRAAGRGGEITLAHAPRTRTWPAARDDRGRYARFFWPGVALVAAAVAAPWIGRRRRAACPARAACARACLRPGRPVRPARVRSRPMTENSALNERGDARVGRPRGRPKRAGRPSTRARAGCTWPRSRRRSAGTTGWSCLAGLARRETSATTCSCRPPASTASRRAGCSPTWTGRPGRSASSRATRSTRARAAATAPRARRRSTRSPTRTGSCTR